ncbi:hypothetical protein ABW20_dc0107503 [Dactylellina cionopaga]|nr:hypothetical protein ABW20_dc0107503 [Dactylellina cionopaga]
MEQMKKKFSPEYLAIVQAAIKRQSQAMMSSLAEPPKRRSKGTTTTTTSRIPKSGGVSKPRTTCPKTSLASSPKAKGISSQSTQKQPRTNPLNQSLTAWQPEAVMVLLQPATGEHHPVTRERLWYYERTDAWVPLPTDVKRGRWWYSTKATGPLVRYQLLEYNEY